MRGHYLVLIASIALFSATFIALLKNEGFFTEESKFESVLPRASIWRQECAGPPRVWGGSFVITTAQVTKLNYFSESIPASYRMEFGGFFEGCRSIGYDFSRLMGDKVIRVTANMYADDRPPARQAEVRRQQPQPLSQRLAVLLGLIPDDERYSREIVATPIDLKFDSEEATGIIELPKEGDVAAVELTLDGALRRAGVAEFGGEAHFTFASDRLPVAQIPKNVRESPIFLGGAFADLIATDPSQRTAVSNPRAQRRTGTRQGDLVRRARCGQQVAVDPAFDASRALDRGNPGVAPCNHDPARRQVRACRGHGHDHRPYRASGEPDCASLTTQQSLSP